MFETSFSRTGERVATTTTGVLAPGAGCAADVTNDIIYGTAALLSSGAAGTLTGSHDVFQTGATVPANVTATVIDTGAAPAPFATAPAIALTAGTTTLPLPYLDIAQGQSRESNAHALIVMDDRFQNRNGLLHISLAHSLVSDRGA